MLAGTLEEEPHREGLLAQPPGAERGIAGPFTVFDGACHDANIDPVFRTGERIGTTVAKL